MGEKNEMICSYLDKPEIFADFINGSIYAGKQVIASEELKNKTFAGKETHMDRRGKTSSRLRIRDVVKTRRKGKQFAVIAVENQDELHFLMPFRCMEYDVEDYARQIRRLIRQHEKAGDLTGNAEFLSGVKEADRLIPVITIVFYHGNDGWSACRELHDMIDFSGENEILKDYTPNYRPNIISLEDLNENHFQTGLREVIGIMKRREDKEKMRQYYRENTVRFEQIDDDTYDMISVMIDHKKLMQYKETNRNMEGKLDMCRAFDEIEEEARMEGRQEGEDMFALLVNHLLADGRVKDVHTAAVNKERRTALYREYSLV